MKKCISVLLALLMLFSCISTATLSALEKKEDTRGIAIVFDNSGSMYVDGLQAWCRATYAMEVFGSMLNKGDTLQIYPMHPIEVEGKEYTMDNPFTITDASKANVIREIFTKDAKGTPIESVDAAIKGVKKLNSDKKYVIVLTDGDKFYKNGSEMNISNTKKELDKRFEKANDNLKMMYLGIGKDVVMPDTKQSDNFVSKKASESEDTLSALTDMCNQIFGRDTLPKNYLSDKELKLDISISKLIVFVQGKNVTDLKVTNDNGDVGTYVSSASTQYGTKGCGNYKSVADKSLQGMMVTYTDCLAGDYKIDYKGKASSVEVYYEPDADLSFVFTDSSGNLVDPNALYEGDYKVSFGMVDAKTDEFISSELLGSPHYEGTYTINGKQETFSSDGMKGEVPISLKMNDTFSADLTVNYLSGYTIKKNSTDFGWPESGISVAPRPAGDLKIKISDGQKYYSLQDLKEGKPYKAEVYYQDKLLKGKELEKVKFTYDAKKSHAAIVTTFADDHYDITFEYKDPKNPADTKCGKSKVPLQAAYAAKGSDTSKAQTSLTYEIKDDFIPVKMDIDAPDDYFVISKMEDSEPIHISFTMDKEPLKPEDFKSLSVNVDTQGIEYKLTADESTSSYDLQLLPTKNIKEGKYKLSINAKYLDHIKRETQIEDDIKVTLSKIPLWIKITGIILALLLILFVIWRILSIRVLPKRIQLSKRDCRYIIDGDNETNAARFTGELNGKQLRVFSKYDGSKMGVSMDVKPGKESYLRHSQIKRYAECETGVKRYGGETITEATIGTARFVLNEETGKLEQTPPSKKPIKIKHGMAVRYSGYMETGGTTKSFSATTKLNFKKK